MKAVACRMVLEILGQAATALHAVGWQFDSTGRCYYSHPNKGNKTL
jgi:hypothetical protein